MNILLLSNKNACKKASDRFNSLSLMLSGLGHEAEQRFIPDSFACESDLGELSSSDFLNSFDCCFMDYQLDFYPELDTEVPLILVLNKRALASPPENELESNFQIIDSNIVSENKFKLFSRAKSFISYSLEDKYYFSSFLVQIRRLPSQSNEKTIFVFDEKENEDKIFLKKLLEESSLPLETSKPSFGLVHERAVCPASSSGYFSKKVKAQTLTQEFVVPADNCVKVGVRLKDDKSYRVKLFDQQNNILSESLLSPTNITWLSSQRTMSLKSFSKGLKALESVRGGDILRLQVMPESNTDLETESESLEIYLDENTSYPYINDCLGGCPLKIYFSFSEYSKGMRALVLAKRGARMIKDGEWERFSSAIFSRAERLKREIVSKVSRE